MPRLHTTKLTDSGSELARINESPELPIPSDADPVVPNSFAEWLAQPSQTITAGPETEQGIFVGLLGQCQVQVSHDASARPRAQQG